MAKRSHTTFQKRQKELARAEKQREKAAKRLLKKQEGGLPENDSDDDYFGLGLGDEAIAGEEAGGEKTADEPTTNRLP